MVNTPYSGNLVRQNQKPDARALPFPSTRHGVTDTRDPYDDSSRVAAGTGSEYAGTEMPTQQAVGGGITLDTPASWTKGNPHESEAVLYNIKNDDNYRETLSRVHGGQDRGYVRSDYDEPPFQSHYEVRSTEQYDESVAPIDGGSGQRHLKYVRGDNGLAENNPPVDGYVNGYRPGTRIWQIDNLKRPGPFTRRYDIQQLFQRDFYVPQATPTQDPAFDTPFYVSVKRAVRSMVTQPVLGRSAGNFDDSMLASPDATDSDSIGSGF